MVEDCNHPQERFGLQEDGGRTLVMKRADVIVSETYLSRVSGGLVVVTVLSDRGESYDWRTNKKKHLGFSVRNEKTGKELVRSAAALRKRKPKINTPSKKLVEDCCGEFVGKFETCPKNGFPHVRDLRLSTPLQATINLTNAEERAKNPCDGPCGCCPKKEEGK